VEEKYSYDDRPILPEDMNVQQISVPVRLPTGEGTCSQSYSSRNIQIEHVLVIEAESRNKDGESNTRVSYRAVAKLRDIQAKINIPRLWKIFLFIYT
jgi:hypothetical protein